MAFDNPLAGEIWSGKYRYNPATGVGDGSLEETWARVARALAEAEAPELRAVTRDRFEAALRDHRFLPAGRILAGAGTGRNVTLFNCFVMGRIPDDLGGIFRHVQEAAVTLQQGGGVGMDFSSIRPAGSAVKGVDAEASGPLSFMDVWDAMCRTILSAGQRRGAMMGCLRIDHPDIEAFIDAKRDGARLRNFNLSVLVTDAFMAALEADADWPLVFGGEARGSVRAADLWARLMRATYDAAEPGVIFIDRVNARNNLGYCETILASNPCGEQMLPPYGACLLGSINLARLVATPFQPGALLDEAGLRELTRTAVRMLDNVIDVSRYPLEPQETEAKAKRRIGLGVTGLADALVFCGVAYGSDRAVELTGRWLATIKREAYRASAGLAAEKGAFPLYDPAILARPNLAALDGETRELIARHGLRNGCLTSIAPTGTTSLLAGNVSSGIEPVFAYSYVRKVRQADGSRREEPVEDYALAVWKRLHGEAPPPQDIFVSAQTLTPEDHVRMQAAAQAQADSSISKTVNCPEEMAFDAFGDIYRLGWRSGCKGMTTYRPNAVTGSVLSVEPGGPTPAGPTPAGPVLAPRPEALEGATYKLVWPESAHAVYVTLNDTEADGVRRPFEIFINSKNMDHYAWTLGLTRMISAVFRRGGDVGFVAEELKAVFDPRGGAWLGGRYVPSLLAAIGGVIERHLVATGADPGADPEAPARATPGPRGQACCPRCGGFELIRKEGCDSCLSCGYSKCG
ncbi:adenosylcobalamin-dependent ribonucleoside-diphosphate reductase [Phenylobacterium sp.]|uniref:adenosylcobalamin-dependent ribonucleoside-diphosphate reductase n=1 Tax=Phenylobacterium sp. TaxID=1871053 RepID=UPI0025FE23B1|nr:adenosylcobalamin-dependent ribonucleoside-diphosphate reductase [Phenylobacterium sp.]MBX3485863.1 adenosylcobalamin-dependent ribonucleoside-diphosphate reductase [Phenylobacterium sp.]